jgi:cytochrome c553
MKTRFLLLFVSAIGLAAMLGSCKPKSSEASPTPDSANAMHTASMAPVERGKYLVNIGGCNDCHTPWKMGANGPEPDMSKMLSGSPTGMTAKAPKLDMPWMAAASATMTAWSGPWGISYSANLTPDSTGLGKWDEATFMMALKNGKHIGNGRPIMPPMPWQAIGKLQDDDLKAIFAYLKSIPAVKNTPPEYEAPAGAPMAAK